jgi:hypothetical protein
MPSLVRFRYEMILENAICKNATCAGNFYFLKFLIKGLLYETIKQTICILLYFPHLNKSVGAFRLKWH